MATAAAELFVKVSADVKGLTSGFKGATDAAKDLGKDINSAAGHWVDATGRMRDASGKFVASARGVGDAAGGMGAALEGAGKQASIFGDVFKGALVGGLAAQAVGSAIGFMTGQLNGAVKSLMEVERTNAQTVNVIRSMGGAANVSAQEVMNFANALEETTGIAAENIQQGQNLLLTFGNIKNGVGESNKIFDQASKLMVDLSAAMGSDAKSAAIQLGKALNDPTQGVTALTRVGVSFTEGQKATIKSLQESGRLMDAQKIILGELQKQFGGTAEAAGKTLPGALARLDNGIQAVMKNAMGPGIPILTLAIGKAADAAFKLANAMMAPGGVAQAIGEAFGPHTQALIIGFGGALTITAIPAVIRLTASVQALALAFVPLLIPMAKFLTISAAIAAAAYPVIKNWDLVKKGLGIVVQTISNWFIGLYNTAVDSFNGMYRVVFAAARGMASALSMIPGIGDGIVAGVERNIAAAEATIAGFKKKVKTNIDAAAGTVSGFAASVRSSVSSLAASFRTDLTSGIGKIGTGFANVSPQIAAAGKAAKQTAEQKRALAKAMQESTDKAFGFIGAINTVLRLYQKQASAARGLASSLAEVDQQALQQGRSFDVAGARAKAYSDNLKAIQSAFGAMSPQARNARAQIEQFTQASANGGAATAQAFAVIDEAAKSLETQSTIALALGRNYDILTETVKSTEDVLGKLIEKGLKPGNKAYDEAAANVTKARKALDSAAFSYDNISSKTLGVLQSLSSITQEALKMADAMGIDLPKEIDAFMVSAASATQRATELAGSIVGVVNGVMSLVELYKVNPILGLIVTGLVALGLAAAFVIDNFTKANAEAERMAQIAINNDPIMQAYADRLVESNERIAQSYKQTMDIIGNLQKTTTDAVTRATFEFMRGIDGWAERLEASLKEAMFKGLMDKIVFETITRTLQKDFDAIGEAVMTKNYGLATKLTKDLAEKTKGLIKPVAEAGKNLLEGLGMVGTQADEVLDRALGKASASARATREAVDQGSRGAVESYMRAQMAAMDRFRNMGLGPGTYEYEVARDQAEAAARQLRGMATGGLVTGPTMARLGEGGRNEAVLPLNDSVYRQLGEGIAAARGGGTGTQVVVQYYGNGKWTREDAAGLGRMMVAELRALGVR